MAEALMPKHDTSSYGKALAVGMRAEVPEAEDESELDWKKAGKLDEQEAVTRKTAPVNAEKCADLARLASAAALKRRDLPKSVHQEVTESTRAGTQLPPTSPLDPARTGCAKTSEWDLKRLRRGLPIEGIRRIMVGPIIRLICPCPKSGV